MLAQNPDTKAVGLLYSKSEDSSKQPIEDAKAYLEGKGIRCVEKTGTTTDEHHLVVRVSQEELSVRSGNTYFISRFTRENVRGTDTGVHVGKTTDSFVERGSCDTNVQHDNVTLCRGVCHGVSTVGCFRVVHFKIEHFHAFPVSLVLLVNIERLEVNVDSRHINLDISSGFEFQVFAFR